MVDLNISNSDGGGGGGGVGEPPMATATVTAMARMVVARPSQSPSQSQSQSASASPSQPPPQMANNIAVRQHNHRNNNNTCTNNKLAVGATPTSTSTNNNHMAGHARRQMTSPSVEERFKIKTLMGRTPNIGALKSKFLNVLGSSNELLNGISNKFALNISSSDSEFYDDEEEQLAKFDDTIDYTKIDFEARRLKARRAHEENVSGRFRYPRLLAKHGSEFRRGHKEGDFSGHHGHPPQQSSKLQHSQKQNRHHHHQHHHQPQSQSQHQQQINGTSSAAPSSSSVTSTSSSSSSTTSSSTSSHSPHQHPISRDRTSHAGSAGTGSLSTDWSRHSGGYGRPGRVIAGARRSDMDIQRDLVRIRDILQPGIGTSSKINNTSTGEIQNHNESGLGSSGTVGNNGGGATASNVIVPPIQTNESTSLAGDISMWVPQLRPGMGRPSNSSTLTSLHDEIGSQLSPSMESCCGIGLGGSTNTTDWRHFIRSESQNSVPSWASSISLDCRAGEETVKEFMQRFVEVLFNRGGNGAPPVNSLSLGAPVTVPPSITAPSSLTLELKSEFGELVRLEVGRQWFTRFLVAKRRKSRQLDEATFQALLQYLALVLFECQDCEDYIPASTIMNLSFIFYRDVEVPGCDAYREYLYIFLRRQPIWFSMRFWCVAFKDAVHTEHDHRVMASRKRAERRSEAEAMAKAEETWRSLQATTGAIPPPSGATQMQRRSVDSGGNPSGLSAIVAGTGDVSSSAASSNSPASLPKNAMSAQQQRRSKDNSGSGCCNKEREKENELRQQLNEIQLFETIAIKQLGTFTFNMHAMGLPQELCLEFLKKQTISLNLTPDKINLVKENIYRMYRETDLWGCKDA